MLGNPRRAGGRTGPHKAHSVNEARANRANNSYPQPTTGYHAFQTGRVLDHYNRPADTRRLCSLYLALMDRMGVELPSFGDASERPTGI